jgi:hypothetical protein
MSDSTFFNEAQDALYQTAKASANFIEADGREKKS